MGKTTKYIFVTGGVTSSLGKGIISASLAKLLQERGYRVTIQKFDPYINIDPGTLNPYEHGEVYVTDDGAETDLDLGHYERFLNSPTSQANNVTTGRVYQTVIQRERMGEYGGKTVQVVPHITDEIKRRMKRLGETGDYDMVITEARVRGKRYFRVSAGGFKNASARSMCSAVKAKGQGCITWAANAPLPGAVDRGVRMASR